MKKGLKTIGALFVGACFVLAIITPANAREKRVRAKIGIQIRSGDLVMRAKSRDTLKPGDLLRIYVHPEETSNVYLIHTDHKTATLLNLTQQKIHSSTLVMPSLQEFYQVDGKSDKESFTVICSPNQMTEVQEIFSSGEAPFSRWAEAEKGFIEKSKIDLSQKNKKPFGIAGNVRGAGGSDNMDPFVSKLQIFSGRAMLIKRYEFRVKK
ncbi:MAG: hypothetical protein JRJ86_19355 [Deltaproteobacteria bacterium]|nr:hypothetical protein [Deltaproteobacteria bacterium]MBW2119917.1 hypothetical protein [Deltaproteobacteria bacterium]